MKYPDRAIVLYKLSEPPTYHSDHLKLEAWVLSERHRRVAARCMEEVAIYDYTRARKAILEPFMVDRLRETYALQRDMQEHCYRMASRVIEAIKEMEGGI